MRERWAWQALLVRRAPEAALRPKGWWRGCCTLCAEPSQGAGLNARRDEYDSDLLEAVLRDWDRFPSDRTAMNSE